MCRYALAKSLSSRVVSGCALLQEHNLNVFSCRIFRHTRGRMLHFSIVFSPLNRLKGIGFLLSSFAHRDRTVWKDMAAIIVLLYRSSAA
jgi:hypothetical protein